MELAAGRTTRQPGTPTESRRHEHERRRKRRHHNDERSRPDSRTQARSRGARTHSAVRDKRRATRAFPAAGRRVREARSGDLAARQLDHARRTLGRKRRASQGNPLSAIRAVPHGGCRSSTRSGGTRPDSSRGHQSDPQSTPPLWLGVLSCQVKVMRVGPTGVGLRRSLRWPKRGVFPGQSTSAQLRAVGRNKSGPCRRASSHKVS
jgi:hypothetical protein